MRHLASQVEDLTIVAECSNALAAYNLIHSKVIDIVFLDIEMPDFTGLELTRQLVDKKLIIIFITAQRHCAIDAFDLNVTDFIVKPVTPRRFLQALDKAREIYNKSRGHDSIEDCEFIFIRDSGMLKRLLLEEIHFIEAMGDYVKVVTQQKVYSTHATLRSVEEKLPINKFLRVHRSYIVALNKVERIEEGVIVINNKLVPVGDIYRSALNKRLNII